MMGSESLGGRGEVVMLVNLHRSSRRPAPSSVVANPRQIGAERGTKGIMGAQSHAPSSPFAISRRANPGGGSLGRSIV